LNGEEQVTPRYANSMEASSSLAVRLMRGIVFKSLAAISYGRIVFIESGEQMQFGRPGSEPTACISVHDPAFYRMIVAGGSLGAAEAYLQGMWDCDDLPALIRIMVRNQAAQNNLESGLASFFSCFQRLLHLLNENTRSGSRKNIAAHYDLGNDFYRLFLDPTMAYSCGYFEASDSTLEDASKAKFDLICRKLELKPGMTLLEIGTGWGGFAMHAARNYGCHVTTTTISSQQHAYAEQLIAKSGMSDRISLLKLDYRDLEGSFDRLVSIEMIEAVGHRFLPEFFRVCSDRLKPDGAALIQVITMPDQSYEKYLRKPEFINRYIFPGGCCPSLTAMTEAMTDSTDLRLAGLEDITGHYARTLREWRCNFHGAMDRVKSMGYPERFIRMWDYYLSYCEGAFEERFTGCLQLLFAKPCHRPPLQTVKKEL
jgi:cyclopropane-fatty-acyl-phospholipid synthase